MGLAAWKIMDDDVGRLEEDDIARAINLIWHIFSSLEDPNKQV